MNEITWQDWVAALRSGKYTQGKGRLKTVTAKGPTYCCLGVLCSIRGYEEGEASFLNEDGCLVFHCDEALLMELFSCNAEAAGAISATLADLNDEGASFEVIARAIERLGEGLTIEQVDDLYMQGTL